MAKVTRLSRNGEGRRLALLLAMFLTGVWAAGAADLTWTGAASAVWDTATLNWQDAGGTACAWTDGNQAVFPSGSTVTNITVSGEVKPTRLKFVAGRWFFGGSGTLRVTEGHLLQASADSTVGVTFKDGLTVRSGTGASGAAVNMNLANLTIEHASFLCPSNRFHNNWSSTFPVQSQGIINIGDGGLLECNDLVLTPQGATTIDYQDRFRINVTTGGVFRLAYVYKNFHTAYYGTIYVDGGDLQCLPGNNKRLLYEGAYPTPSTIKQRILLGPGGLVLNGNKFTGLLLDGGEGDGGVVLNTTSHFYLKNGAGPNAPINGFAGGLHVKKDMSNNAILVNGDRNLGAVPDVPTTNIFVDASSTLLAEGAPVDVHSNRIVRIAANKQLRIGGNGARLSFHGPILGAAPDTSNNGEVTTYNPYWKGTPALEPAANVTNKFGRLLVRKYDLLHGGEGVTEVDQVTTSVEGHSGSFDVWEGATLSVTGGILRVVNGKWTANCGNVKVSGGLLDFSKISGEYMNAFRVPGTTTVSRAGRIICNNYRMGEGGEIASPEMGLTRLETNGVMQVNTFYMTYSTTTWKLNSRAQLDWNGGIAATRGATLQSNFLGTHSSDHPGLIKSWHDNVKVYVREGGAVVSNNCEIRIRQPLLCGVAEGQTDGGFTKWGTGMMAFVGDLEEGQVSFNTFNGPINVEQGTLTMGSNSNFLPTVALNVRSGATFNANSPQHQTFASLGGTGRVTNPSALTVTDAFAPGYGTNTLGTLTITGALAEVKDGAELQIDLDDEGHSDCLSYAAPLDLSKLRLVVNDTTKLNSACKYTIASNLTSCVNDFAASNLPNGWVVRQETSGGTTMLKLSFLNGTKIIFR